MLNKSLRYCFSGVFSLYIILLLTVFPLICKAQITADNRSLIEQRDFHDHQYDKLEVSFLTKGKKSILVKYNPLVLVFGGLMYMYQGILSTQFATRCGYEITCSRFGVASIREFGLLKGVPLAADRLTRCTPLAANDIMADEFNDEQQVVDPPSKYRIKP